MEIQYIENTNLAICDNYKFRKDKKRGYWYCSVLHKYLHVYVYEKYNGKIKKGYEVHHRDKNKDNNNIDNLILLSVHEHRELHANELTEKDKEWRRKNLNDNARPKACEWHKSKEGRKWHKEHFQNMKDKLFTLKDFKCLQCGKEYQSVQIESKFCCNACKSKWRRVNHLDDEERCCVICGNKYKTSKYSKVKTCNKECAKKLIKSIKENKRRLEDV